PVEGFYWGRVLSQLSADSRQALLVRLAEAQVAAATGEARLSQALDFDQSPGTAVGGAPALGYDSAAAQGRRPAPRPTLGCSSAGVPDRVEVAFAWDGQGFGQPAVFSTARHEPGDGYLLDLPVSPPAGGSGEYRWQAQLTLFYGVGAGAVAVHTVVSGDADVVDESTSALG